MSLAANLSYWTLAWLNLLAIVLLAWTGVAKIRRQQLAAHRRRMLTASAHVGLFLLSYPLKLWILGREGLGPWATLYVITLRIHEGFIALMLIAGIAALWIAHRLRLRVAADGSAALFPAHKVPGRLLWHRRCGRTAVLAASGAFITSAVVLYGMYARSLTL